MRRSDLRSFLQGVRQKEREDKGGEETEEPLGKGIFARLGKGGHMIGVEDRDTY